MKPPPESNHQARLGRDIHDQGDDGHAGDGDAEAGQETQAPRLGDGLSLLLKVRRGKDGRLLRQRGPLLVSASVTPLGPRGDS